MNAKHDSKVINEYYEAVVGKDVRSTMTSSSEATEVLNPAFSLIDCQVLQYQKDRIQNVDHLHPEVDPVKVLPSLKGIVEKNPDKEFFMVVFFHANPYIAIVQIFTRSLPRGVDVEFDNRLDIFSSSAANFRNNIEVSLQLGPKRRLLYPILFGMQLKKIISRSISIFNKKEEPYVIWPDTKRMSFPSLNLSKHAKVHHFGGSYRDGRPNNYVALTCQFLNSLLDSYPTRLLSILSFHGSKNVIDYILHFKASESAPNVSVRPLACVRLVHIDPSRLNLSADTNESIHTNNDGEEVGQVCISSTECKHMEEHDEEIITPDLDSLREILSCITVPVRVGLTDDTVFNSGISKDDIQDVQVLSLLSDGDLNRHLIATGSKLKEAAVRIVQCAAWRGFTFPIDTRACQVELQKNQLFFKGFDKEKNPVCYFRNMLKGIWRKDVDASILATLFTLEQTCQNLLRNNPNYVITIVVFMGPVVIREDDDRDDSQNLFSKRQNNVIMPSIAADSDVPKDPNDSSSETVGGADASLDPNGVGSEQQSRVDKTKTFNIHTNFKLVNQLIDVVSKNYPERLARALILPNGGWDKMIGTHGLRRYVPSQRTRQKIHMLDNIDDLKKYISEEELRGVLI
mmetsp:Transcript_11112/g.12876  ORF Transcript_11112/g.12876 Transcript_11112/m.12876 type:complete len:627 (+) Transcript_11112:111-1991(+)